MRILIIHNYYLQAGGEDAVFEQEAALLAQRHTVEVLKFYNKGGIAGARQFIFSVWNIAAAAKVKKAIQQFKPDVVHLHNWHFACGPVIIRSIKKQKVALVLTLHNYRLLCPSGSLMASGKIFTKSLHENFPWTAVSKKAYRNSSFQTFWLAFIIWLHKLIGTWKMPDKYITLTEFALILFKQSKLHFKKDQLVVKYNFLPDPELQLKPRNDVFFFAGRLTEEKGIIVLLNAFKNNHYKLIIAGDGPLKDQVEQFCSIHPQIKYVGKIDNLQIKNHMQTCTALIFPSIWFEGMPMTLLEAFATATPVITGNIGAMQTMIKDGYNGLHFDTSKKESLEEILILWQRMPENLKLKYAANARNTYEQNYTPGKNSIALTNIYKAAIKQLFKKSTLTVYQKL